YALLPIYTLGEGLSENASLYALSAFSAGGIAMQYPLGRYADRAGRQALMVLSATGVLIGIIALPFVVGNIAWLMALLFIWGGMVFGVYTAGLIMLGDEYPSESLVAVNAMFIIFYEAGALVGPALSGAAMDKSPRHGFVSFLTVVAIMLLAITVYRRFRRAK
ncbi:MAG TPA: MFS transporter, partial [Rhodospirillales bacterium]|nr:MFS transporter [Rhodospirillales bacterium]